MRESRQGSFARHVRAVALGKAGQMRDQGRADVRGKAGQMREVRHG
jgi:hypothetical protein